MESNFILNWVGGPVAPETNKILLTFARRWRVADSLNFWNFKLNWSFSKFSKINADVEWRIFPIISLSLEQ